MAYKITGICDKCKTEETRIGDFFKKAGPKGFWNEVQLKTSHDEEKRFLLCPKCREELGLVVEDKAANLTESLADRLFEVIAEIVRETQVL
jgi:dissimilatory sulfite reductase (desulfoviridin) alpha/beta subunit